MHTECRKIDMSSMIATPEAEFISNKQIRHYE